jgi:uncharacterized protein YabE (DUF348 family)
MWSKTVIASLCLLFAVCMVACGAAEKVKKESPVIQVDGIEIYQDEWDKTKEELTKKVSFETKCEEDLEFTLIRKLMRYPVEVGIKGCGKNMIWSRATNLNAWKLKSGDEASGDEKSSGEESGGEESGDKE